MRVYRASRRSRNQFDPLDSKPSVARDGWRFNDRRSEILYAAEVQALAVLEVVARPGWETIEEITVAVIEVPDRTVVELTDVGLILPTNWNQRPAARNAQRIGGEFLAAINTQRRSSRKLCGVRVPSVISTTDYNILLDPRQRASYHVVDWVRLPFDWLLGSAT